MIDEEISSKWEHFVATADHVNLKEKNKEKKRRNKGSFKFYSNKFYLFIFFSMDFERKKRRKGKKRFDTEIFLFLIFNHLQNWDGHEHDDGYCDGGDKIFREAESEHRFLGENEPILVRG